MGTAGAQLSGGEVLRLLGDIHRLVDGPEPLDETLDEVLRRLADQLGIVRGTITLVQRDLQEIHIEAAYGLSDVEQSRGRYQLGEGITGQVVETGQAVVVPRIADADLLNRTGAPRAGDAAFFSVPIKVRDEAIGTLGIDLVAAPEALDELRGLLQVVAAIIAQTASLRQARREIERQRADVKDPQGFVGRSKAMRHLAEAIQTVAASDATVLVLGESGVGKELVADAIHAGSPRASRPLVKVNCAALPQSVIESELFGHEEGAFTGATRQRKGRFEVADGGTIFLDEIGDLAPSTQVTLLRILQNREFQRVGGHETLGVDVRVIGATSRDLEALMAKGEFRQDLYYRLAVFPIQVPALRERKTDVPLLADTFAERFGRKNGKRISRISSQAIDMLMAYHWPGNVRELENCMERAVLLSTDGVIHARHLPPTLQTAEATETVGLGSGLEATLHNLERDLVDDALKTTRGNQAAAARALQITERKLGLRIKKLGLDARRHRPR